MKRLLISGIASPLGELTAATAAGELEVAGIDRVPARTAACGRALRAFALDPATRRLGEVLQSERPDAVLHLPRPDGAATPGRALGDTLRLLEAARDAGVRQVVVLSSALLYGPSAAARPFRDENAALATTPSATRLHAGAALDVAAALFGVQHGEIRVAVLRAVSTLGAGAASGLGLLLGGGTTPVALGHDPLIQLLHSADLVTALLAAAAGGLRGVFNVTGPDPLPLSVGLRESGGTALPLPASLLRTARRIGLAGAEGDLDFLLEPCTVNGDRFAAATGFAPRWTLHDLLREARKPIAA